MGRTRNRRLRPGSDSRARYIDKRSAGKSKIIPRKRYEAWDERHNGNQVAEWWPSSAKMVLNKNYPNGIHIHDYQQAMAELASFFQ